MSIALYLSLQRTTEEAMSDLETYLNHCYDLLLKSDTPRTEDEELCACASLVAHDETTNH